MAQSKTCIYVPSILQAVKEATPQQETILLAYDVHGVFVHDRPVNERLQRALPIADTMLRPETAFHLSAILRPVAYSPFRKYHV